MFKSHLTVAIRSLLRQKEFSFINVLGLTVGLTCSLLMLLWVQNQRSFDDFHSKGDSIYQVLCNVQFGSGGIQTWRGTPYPYSQSFKNDFPEVEDVVITSYTKEHFLRVDHKKGKARGVFSNEALFQVFDFPILKGNPNELLTGPDQIVISKKQAEKYFGNLWGSAVGNTILVDEESEFQISGIFDDIPSNSSIKFDYVLPYKKLLAENKRLPENYGDYNNLIYVQLREETDKVALVDKLLQTTAKKLEGSNYDTPEGMILQPLKDKYLYNEFKDGQVAGGRIDYVRLFFLGALFILFIACINYTNLATARATQRAKEVGIRKTIGAGKGSLLTQFFTEAVVMSSAAILLAITFVQLLLPWFNELASTTIGFQMNQTAFWLLIGLVFLGTTLLTGIYPAYLLSSFKINKVLKGELSSGLSASKLRKGLVVFQFLISALLIMGAVSMQQQMIFLKNKDLGLDRDNMIVVSGNDQLVKNYQAFKDQLNQHPEISSVSASAESPVSIGSSTGDPTWEGFTEDKRTIFKRLVAGFNFLESMKIPLVAGRYANANRAADSTAILVNEMTARAMGMENPVGKTLSFWGEDWNIVGMVKDFHLSSLHTSIAPLVVVHSEEWFNDVYVRPAAGKTKEAIALIQTAYNTSASAYPFEYDFLDQQYEEMYHLEQTTGAIANLFALIALFISALGLLGLAAFSAERRTKEIGIRKVLGASVSNLVALLSKDFLRLVLLALLIAMPIGWYIIQQWLENYAYHINVDWSTYAIMIGSALLVAGLTVGIQAFRAAIANPIEAIKSE